MNLQKRTLLIFGGVLLLAAGLLTLPGGRSSSPAADSPSLPAVSIPPSPRNYVLIDNRTSAEFAAGHLPGAVHLPHDTISEKIAAAVPDKNTPVKLYCRSGRRSEMAKTALEKLGYTQVENLGGMKDAGKILGLTPEK